MQWKEAHSYTFTQKSKVDFDKDSERKALSKALPECPTAQEIKKAYKELNQLENVFSQKVDQHLKNSSWYHEQSIIIRKKQVAVEILKARFSPQKREETKIDIVKTTQIDLCDCLKTRIKAFYAEEKILFFLFCVFFS